MSDSAAASRFVVTGAAGFLGSHLCEALLRRGHEVIGIDDLSSGRRSNVAGFGRHPSFSFREADVNDGIPVRGPVDGVFHLVCPTPAVTLPTAGPADRPVDRLPPAPTGTGQVTEFAARRHTRLLLVGATGQEYEDPFNDDASAGGSGLRGTGTVGASGATLRPGTYVDLRIARLFSAYGPRMEPEDEPTMMHLLLQAITGQPMSVTGTPEETRGACFVSDLINGMLRLFRSELSGVPVDLGDPTEHPVGHMVDEIRHATGTCANVEYRATRSDPQRRPRPDIGLATERLGWAPHVPLSAGVQTTARWLQSELGPTVGHGAMNHERRSA